MLISADNPVIRIVKAVVLVAKSLLTKVPLALIHVPKGMSGADAVESGCAIVVLGML